MPPYPPAGFALLRVVFVPAPHGPKATPSLEPRQRCERHTPSDRSDPVGRAFRKRRARHGSRLERWIRPVLAAGASALHVQTRWSGEAAPPWPIKMGSLAAYGPAAPLLRIANRPRRGHW